MIDYTIILTYKYAGSQWVLNGDDYSGLEWLSNTPKPSKKTLDDLWDTVQAELAAEKKTNSDTKASALAKLAALGLTEDEAKAIIG
jgi:hypothetical protein